MWSIHC
ncbi:hypothetical protein LINPERPRIM_LOCUS25371 [Linum perenne]